VTGFTVMAIIGAAVAVTPEMQQLTADMREALRLCGWDGKQTAVAIGVSPQRLSLQLGNKEPFTLLVRFRKLTNVWREFLTLQLRRDRTVLVLPDGYEATVYRADEEQRSA
jgi:hypothetical protein